MADDLNSGSGGGIGEHVSDRAEQSNESGMSVDDAATSAFNDWDEKTHGISEASRTVWGPELKKMADHEGTNVRDGVNALVSSHINKRYGAPEIKRQAILTDIDAYQINAVPTVEAAPQYDATGDADFGQPSQPILDQAQANEAVSDFVQSNPVAGDPSIQAAMISIAEDMVRQGHTPHLPTMLQHAVKGDPRYSQAAAQAQEADQVARAKAANVQVSGGGKSTGAGVQSSDVGDILDELVPHF